MKQSTLDIICCPTCHSMLSLSTKVENENVKRGNLHCSTCDRNYPIQNGIVQFIKPNELEGSNQYFERYYNRLAPFYMLFSKFALLPFGGERKARKEILDRLEMAVGRVLEISIGNGVNLPYLFKMSKPCEISFSEWVGRERLPDAWVLSQLSLSIAAFRSCSSRRP